MRNKCIFSIFCVSGIAALIYLAGCAKKQGSDYLGEEPPGLEPKVFAPGIVSTEEFMEASITFTPDAKECYFTRGTTFRDQPRIMVSYKKWPQWTPPDVAAFSGIHFDFEPNITPDGSKMFFMRFDPRDMNIRRGIWVMERKGGGWGGPVFFSEGMYATATTDGTLYYGVTEGSRGIVCAQYKDGEYSEPEYLGGGVNVPVPGSHPCIAADGSFIIFDSQRPEAPERADLYVCFKQDDGEWSEAYSLGSQLNENHKNCASLSPDGKYLFYAQFKPNGFVDIYWVSAEVIHRLRPQG